MHFGGLWRELTERPPRPCGHKQLAAVLARGLSLRGADPIALPSSRSWTGALGSATIRAMDRRGFFAVFAVLLAGVGFFPVHAVEDLTATLLACADESDDQRRLRCFDAATAALRSEPRTLAVASTPAASPSTATPALSAEDSFGARRDPGHETRLKEITAVVAAASTRPHGELVITLDNGQLWTELAPGSRVRVKQGDSVKIKAGALGSFHLVAPNGRSSKVSRLR